MKTTLRKTAKYFTCILTLAIVLSGCKTVEEPPELIDPVSMKQTFRPVEKKIIGSPKILVGHYVPQEYCHFFKKATPIKEITCDIGQYVNEGDVLVCADTEKLREEMEDIQASLDLCIAKHLVKQPIHSCTVKSLEAQSSTCECLEDAERLTAQIGVEKENYEYDEKLYEFMVEKYNEEIADLEELIRDGTLRAKKSGYVTFVKNTGITNQANAYENIVIVSDDTDLHIEVSGLTTKAYLYKDFEIKYAIIDGKEVPIEEYNYSNKELAYAKAQESYPNIRFKTVEDIPGEAGRFVMLYFINRSKEEVLVVGRDAANVDDAGNYVYVKGEGDSLEKRYFEAGSGDDHYLEVKSGLQEGEMTLYVQEAVIPDQYEPYQITLTDYVQTLPAKRYQQAETVNTAYFTPCSGRVKDVLVVGNDHVKKGDTLAIIDSEGGESKLTEAENAISHVQLDYVKKCREQDKQIEELKKQTADLIKIMEKSDPSGNAGGNEYRYKIVSAQRTILENEVNIRNLQKELARLEYESALAKNKKAYQKLKKNNNGSGEYAIVATSDGVVSKVYVKKGTAVELDGENSLILSCAKQSGDKIAVTMPQNDDLYGSVGSAAIDTGRKLVFQYENQRFETTCIGSLYNQKNYIFSEGDKTYVTNCSTEGIKEGFITTVTDPAFFKDGEILKDCVVDVEVMRSPKMIVVPGHLVYEEKVKLSNDVQYFVWKLENDDLVKQYVTIGKTYGIGTGESSQIVILTGIQEGDVLAEDISRRKETENR